MASHYVPGRGTAIHILLLLATLPAFAQFPSVKTGRYGAFVQASRELRGPRFVLERTESGSRDWKRVAVSDYAPRSAEELRVRLLSLTAKNPLYSPASDTMAAVLFHRFSAADFTDSLYTYGYNPQVLEALGVGFLDTSAVAGHTYEYRLKGLKDAATTSGRPSKPVTMPDARTSASRSVGERLVTTPRLVHHRADGATVEGHYWLKKPVPTLAGLRVRRAAYAQTDFTDIPAEWGFRKGKKDSVFVFFLDRNVRRKMVYQYTVTPLDFLGNEGQASDTLTVAGLRTGEALPVIAQFQATSAEKQQAIRLSWQLSSTKDLRSVDIWRSTRFDGPFTRVATALPADTVYYDANVEPVESYYYQLRPNGYYDELPASVKVSGMVKAYRANLTAPSFLKLRVTPDSLHFSWSRSNTDTRGYYLYYSPDPTTPFVPYSGLISATGTSAHQAVAVQNLPVGVSYRWAVAALNTSYSVSPMSNEVHSPLRLPNRVATPMNPVVLPQERGVLVVWDNMIELDPYITGYVVCRTVDGQKETEAYRQTRTDRARNAWADSSVVRGRTYTYRVKAVRSDAVESAFSAATSPFFRPLPPVLPLRGLGVMPTTEGVRLSWSPPLDQQLDGVQVYRYTAKTTKPRLIATLPGRMTDYLDRDATPGIAYFYTLVAVQPDKRESDPTDPVGINW
ncbi:fibronectin type III domain-containing protein [Fibrella arboris]|uniref:fibronectin type III domain-containing protein n=1 Tax=Fibrella arboris TaxID=3242486 RepID=UPI003521E3DC